jgi:hypothetical protein
MSDLTMPPMTVWAVLVFAIGGAMYVVMSVSTRGTDHGPSNAMQVRRPGWIARRRARAGIAHRPGRVGVGYRSAMSTAHLTGRELAHHGAVFGGPGSGKTTFLQLLIEANAGRMPVVVVDPKGSPALASTVQAHGGVVWTLDGRIPADLLDPRPWQVPDLLLEAEEYSADARPYRDAAHQRALWAAWALALRQEPMDLVRLRTLLDRTELLRALQPHRDRDARVADWLRRLEHQHGGIEDSGARGLDRSLGTLLDGVTMRGSLRACPEALRLDDVLTTNGLVLFSLDAAEYPHATRKVASWILLGMARVARQLGANSVAETSPRALLLVDEVGALGSSARHLRGLVGRARESGLAVVLATQGPSDLEAVDRALLPQVLQDTAWQLVFRQGSPHDARQVEALFGQAWTEDVMRWSNGRSSSRKVERPRVSVDEWMNAMQPGDAWLRVAPIDKGWRQERVRVAMPRQPMLGQPVRSMVPVNASVTYERSDRGAMTDARVTDAGASDGDRSYSRAAPTAALPPVPPECPAELLERVGDDILAKVEQRECPQREFGPCLVWTGARGPDAQKGPYGRIYDAAAGRTDYVHRIVWRRCYGVIPDGQDVDHRCNVTLCQRPDHLQLLTKPENTRRRHMRARSSTPAPAAPTFTIATFRSVSNTVVQQRTLTLEELAVMLSRFEILTDKRRSRCWSPTLYAAGATTRGNAGVEAVSALVFDMDRVPPDPARLEGVCWIGHTTWSHRPEAPRWRVVIPLSRPVPAANWQDIWQRARAALCPEADPSCKDASRQYYLPSHAPAIAPETVHHAGALLDITKLPPLPTQPRRAARMDRQLIDGDGRRGEAYMDKVIANFEAATPGGRNAALNHAAWTLGRWVAAGALAQAEVEETLYAAAELNGLVADDGQRQCWATIRSGLNAGMQEPVDLYAS